MSTEKAKLAAKVSYHRRVAAHPLFPRWTSILQRTGHRKGAKPSDVAVYAKRGIDICAEWLSFDAFEKWALANGYVSVVPMKPDFTHRETVPLLKSLEQS